MSQAIFAAFDSTTIGAHLGLSNGNLQLQTQVTSDNLRMARSTSFAIHPSNVEFLIYSPDGTKPSLSLKAMMIGVCVHSASLANYIGGDANGWGYSPYDGYLYTNGVAVAYFGKATYGEYISLVVDTINGTLAVWKNSQPLGTPYALPANKNFYFGATVSGTSTGMALIASSGPLFANSIANLTGWWTPRVTPNPIFTATEPYISLPTDTLKHQKFNGDVDSGSDEAHISRCIDLWQWGQKPGGMTNGASITLNLLDPYKLYEAYLNIDVRDLPVTISRVAQNTALDLAESVYEAVIDKVDQISDQSKRFTLKDKLAKLQAQLVRPVYPPTADPAVAGRTLSMALGICRGYVPDLYDATNFYWGCSDTPISAFGLVRIQGVPQVYGGSYVVTVDGRGIQTITGSGTPMAPGGKLTVESTSYDGAFSTSNADLFAGQGLFESLAIAGQPTLPTILCYPIWEANTNYSVNKRVTNGGNTYWCITAGTSAGSGGPTGTGLSIADNSCEWSYYASPSYTAWQAGHAYTAGQYCYNGPNTYKCLVSGTSAGSGGPTGTAVSGIVDNIARWGYVGIFSTGHQPAQGSNFTLNGSAPNKVMTGVNVAAGSEWMFTNHPDYFITPGRSYSFSIKVPTAPYYGTAVDVSSGNPTKVVAAKIFFNCVGSYFNSLGSFWLDKNAVENSTSESVYTYTGAFTFNTVPRGNSPMPLYIGMQCNSIIQNPSTIDLTIAEITLNELPDIGQQSTLAGPGLDYMLRNLLLAPRGPYTSADYNSTQALAIDAAKKYIYGLYAASDSTESIEQYVKRLLSSINASLYLGRDGKVKIFQLVKPEDQTAIGSLGVTDFQSELLRIPDNAENLTTRFAGAENISPYTDADFTGISDSQCPAATRELLKRNFGWIVTGGSQVAARYEHANTADPLPTCLDVQADGQTEANNITEFYADQRNFYVVEVSTPIGRTLDIGDIWNVTYPNGSLVDGQNLIVVGLIEKPTSCTSTVYFWGL